MIEGHLTQTEKKHIHAIKKAGMMDTAGAKANRKSYTFSKDGELWQVKISENKRDDYGHMKTRTSMATFEMTDQPETKAKPKTKKSWPLDELGKYF